MVGKINWNAGNNWIAPPLIALMWVKHIVDTKTNILRNGPRVHLCDGNWHTMQQTLRKTYPKHLCVAGILSVLWSDVQWSHLYTNITRVTFKKIYKPKVVTSRKIQKP